MLKSQITYSAEETQTLATELAKKILQRGARNNALVLSLSGDLGAGKTTFLQGFAKGLGIKEKILSPTFILMKRFGVKSGIFKNFYHIDCYRLKDEEDLEALNFREMVENPENIIAIEWPERIKKVLPKEVISIVFKHFKDNKRNIKISLFSFR